MRNFRITVNGNVYDVSVEEIAEKGVIKAPNPVPVQAAPAPKAVSAPAPAPAQTYAPAPAPKAAALSAKNEGIELKCPMPGMIVNLMVPNGSAVKRGQVVLSLEAMKMENDIAANADGVITFTVSKGANVDTDDVLAVIS